MTSITFRSVLLVEGAFPHPHVVVVPFGRIVEVLAERPVVVEVDALHGQLHYGQTSPPRLRPQLERHRVASLRQCDAGQRGESVGLEAAEGIRQTPARGRVDRTRDASVDIGSVGRGAAKPVSY